MCHIPLIWRMHFLDLCRALHPPETGGMVPSWQCGDGESWAMVPCFGKALWHQQFVSCCRWVQPALVKCHLW